MQHKLARRELEGGAELDSIRSKLTIPRGTYFWTSKGLVSSIIWKRIDLASSVS